jgi:MoxR-like ATPase
MQEHKVSVAGADRELPAPFHVLATQNPLEQEGTYPLPEAQLDRFLMQIDVGYPDLGAERRMLIETTGAIDAKPVQVMTAEELIEAQRLVRHVPIGERVVEGILTLVRAGRPMDTDHASQALALAARARALLEGRLSPSLDDVVALARPILRHRMALSFTARADGVSLDGLIDALAARLG